MVNRDLRHLETVHYTKCRKEPVIVPENVSFLDTGFPEKSLIETVADYDIAPCSVLEIGCGTGTNAIWLTEQGFKVAASDISEVAISQA